MTPVSCALMTPCCQEAGDVEHVSWKVLGSGNVLVSQWQWEELVIGWRWDGLCDQVSGQPCSAGQCSIFQLAYSPHLGIWITLQPPIHYSPAAHCLERSPSLLLVVSHRLASLLCVSCGVESFSLLCKESKRNQQNYDIFTIIDFNLFLFKNL